jgi:transcription antitermination factor NusG
MFRRASLEFIRLHAGWGCRASILGFGGCVEGVEKTCLTDQMAAGAGALLGRDSDVRTSRWYALYVRSRHEKVVESGLRSKGYSAFSPFYRTKRKRVDRIAEIDVPLFPGYVFCCFDPNIRLPILMTPGIVGVVGPGHRPEPVDDVEIASIRTLALSGHAVQPWPFLRSGQRIRLQSGPLIGAEGIFLRVKDEYHLVVSITLLQRAVSVVIEKDAVAPLFVAERHVKSF